MITLNLPLKPQAILKLKAGDKVSLNGTIFTARDKAHQFLLKNNFPKIKGAAIYHCGPIMRGREVISAGPTTSRRMSLYVPDLLKQYQTQVIIGKGGLDAQAAQALKGRAVYLAALGGAGVLCAQSLRFKSVAKKEFGMPEAIWEFEVKNFPAVVAIDAHGRNLYQQVEARSAAGLARLLAPNSAAS